MGVFSNILYTALLLLTGPEICICINRIILLLILIILVTTDSESNALFLSNSPFPHLGVKARVGCGIDVGSENGDTSEAWLGQHYFLSSILLFIGHVCFNAVVALYVSLVAPNSAF